MLTLHDLTQLIMQQAKEKGFGTKPEDINIPEKIALIHSEVSEAYEAYRHKKMNGPDGFGAEFGDIIQRVLHLCGALNIDIEAEILKKIEHNKHRDWDWKNLEETNTIQHP